MGASSPKYADTVPQKEEQFMQQLHNRYLFKTDSLLISKLTNTLCTLCKITGYTKQQCIEIKRTINSYNRSECPTIMHLREFGQVEKDSFCSNEQTYYLIFDGDIYDNLKREYLQRKKNHINFTNQQIMNIITSVLCAFQEYKDKFKRKQIDIQFSTILYDRETHKISMLDPWLLKNISGIQDLSNSNISTLSSYPSPEKMRSNISVFDEYDENLSNLFSIGAIGLILHNMKSDKTSLYTSKFGINQPSINNQLQRIKDNKLRNGLQILLSDNPNFRQNIYKYWGINCQRAYYLQSVQNSNKKNGNLYRNQQQINYVNKPQSILLKSININSNHRMQQNGFTNISNPENYTNKCQIYQPQYKNHVKPVLGNPWQKKQLLNYHRHTSSMHHSKINVNFNHHPNIVHNKQIYNQLGIKQAQSRIKPVNTILSPLPSVSRKKQAYSNQNKSVSPQRNSSPSYSNQRYYGSNRTNRSPIMTTSLQLQNTNKQITINPYQEQDNFNIKVIKTDRTNLTQKSDQTVKYPPNQQHAMPNYSPLNNYNNQNKASPQNISEKIGYQKYKSSYKSLQMPIKSSQKVNISQLTMQSDQVKPQFYYQSPQKNKNNYPLSQNDSSIHVHKNTGNPLKTPQMKNKLKHRYNSTIVEVNEDEASQKSVSDHAGQQYVDEEYQSGSRFEGYMKGGQKNGPGRFYFVDGGIYDGNWKGDQMHGWGKLYYQNNKLAYQGNWSNGQFDGYGKVFNDNPAKLSENFDYTNFDYLGEYWRQYQGMFSKDTKQGRGRIFLTNGEIFEGDFHNDRIQGFGKFLRKDGVITQGIWKDSKLIKILNT